MKQSGLQNRFSDEVRAEWIYWYDCMVCGMNGWQVLHHIISPSSRIYRSGDHNTSVFNSAPVHNYTHPNASKLAATGYIGHGVTHSCHIGNESYLYSSTVIRQLLIKTYNALMMAGYGLKPVDKKFLEIYADAYLSDDA